MKILWNKTVALYIVTLLILPIILWFFRDTLQLGKTREIISTISVSQLLIPLFFICLQIFFSSMRLWALMPKGSAPPATYVCYVVSLGQLLNTFIPARAGDLLKIGLLHGYPGLHENLSILTSSSVILLDKAVDIVALVLLLLLIGSQLLSQSVFPVENLLYYALYGLAGVLVIAFMIRLLPKRWREPLRAYRNELTRGFSAFHNWRQLTLALFLGMLNWLSETFAIYQLSHSLHASITVAQALWLITLLNLAIFIPISVANVGAFEASLAFGFTRIGFSYSLGLAVGVLHHALQIMGIFVLTGVFTLFRLKRIRATSPGLFTWV